MASRDLAPRESFIDLVKSGGKKYIKAVSHTAPQWMTGETLVELPEANVRNRKAVWRAAASTHWKVRRYAGCLAEGRVISRHFAALVASGWTLVSERKQGRRFLYRVLMVGKKTATIFIQSRGLVIKSTRLCPSEKATRNRPARRG